MTTIAQERSGLAQVGLRLRRREEWGARFGNYGSSRPVTEPAETQHIHITITNPRNYSSDDAHARVVESIGISRFPATGISYSRLFMQSGGAFEGQPIGRRGAHTVNDFKRSTCSTSGCPGRGGSLRAPSWNNNITGRAYVICQNVGDAVTDAQIDSMARCMAADRLAGFVRRDAKIHGHRCCSSKSCPGDRMWRRMGELRSKVDHYVRVGLGGGSNPEEDDMTPEQWATLQRVDKNLTSSMQMQVSDRSLIPANTRVLVGRELAPVRDALAELTGREVAEVDEAELAREIGAALLPAVLDQLDGVELTQAQMEAAVANVLRKGVGEQDA